MYHFHVSIHARPDDCQLGPHLTLAGADFAVCTISPEWLGRSTLPRSFEAVAADLARLERMYIEPDGCFVWVSGNGETPWQVDGNLYDHQERVRLVDVKGSCPRPRFDQLLARWAGHRRN